MSSAVGAFAHWSGMVGKMEKAKETATVRMPNGKHSEMEVCGDIPSHNGQRAIVVSNGVGCFAARLTPAGWVIITEPVRLYPVMR